MTSRSDTPRLLTAAEAAARLRTTPMRIVELCRSGDLPATKPLGRWLIREEDIDALLAAGSNAIEHANGGAA